jgi:hypothetical protein
MSALPQMPFAPGAQLEKADGKPYGEHDREYWERADRPFEHNGVMSMRGLREHRHLAFPKMIYKALNERGERDSFERQEVQSERHLAEVQRKDPAWCEAKADATAFLTAKRNDASNHAAEAAYKAERMSPVAKRAYTKRSAASPDHVQE